MSVAVLRTAAGAQVQILGMRLTMGLEGAWQAHLELGEDAAPTGAVTLEVAREGGAPATWSGVVDHGDTWQGRQKLLVRAGAGGLDGALERKEYVAGSVPVPAAKVVTDIVAVARERLADPALLALRGLGFARWDRPGGFPASRALGRAVKRLGLGWRFLDAGTIWIGTETWAAVDDQLVSFLEDRDGDILADRCAPDAAVLRPGTTIMGRRIYRVTYTVNGDGMRAELLYRSDRQDFANAVRAVSVPDPLTLVYEAKVDSQTTDGTLDLIVDEPLLPELRSVRYRSINGTKESFAGGESVLLAFLGGREDGAICWGAAQDPNASEPLALVGDGVSAGQLTVASPDGVTLQWTPPGGAPGVPSASVTLSGLTVTGPGHKRAKGEPGP
jgi:hypothetical protein